MVVRLSECHGRIRSFLGLAARLAAAPEPPREEVAEAAGRVHRYFAVALPLHVRDEQESIGPRLRGRDRTLDRALLQMEAEHLDHEPAVARLLTLCQTLQADPGRLHALRSDLAGIAAQLDTELDGHLALEEAVVFPAIDRYLEPVVRAAVVAEMRARRA